MKNLASLKQNLLQRITYDDVMTRMGTLTIQTINQILASVVGRRHVLIQGGQFELDTGMTFKIAEDSFWMHKITPTEINAIAHNEFVQVTLDTESSGNDRIDLIEARALVVARRPITVDTINQLTGAVSQTELDTDNTIILDIRVTKGTPAGSPVCPAAEGLSLCNFINDGNQGQLEVDLTDPIDLSSLYNINVSIDNTAFRTIDLRGSTPNATTRQEIVNNINADSTFTPFAIQKTTQSFTSSTTTVTITTTSHGLITGQSIVVSNTSNASDLPNGTYVVTVLTSSTFTVITAAAGDDAGGTCDWDFKVAALSGTKYIKIQSPTNTSASRIRFIAPASLDATVKVLGLVEETSYFYKIEPTLAYFKIGEVLVQDSASSLVSGNLRDAYEKELWTTKDEANDIVVLRDIFTDQTTSKTGGYLNDMNFLTDEDAHQDISYDGSNRVSKIIYRRGGAGSNIIAVKDYAYDGADNITTETIKEYAQDGTTEGTSTLKATYTRTYTYSGDDMTDITITKS